LIDPRRSRLLPGQDNAKEVHWHRYVLQFGPGELLEARLERVANLPFHVHGDTNSTRARKLFDPGGDIHSVAVHIAAAMHHVTNVDADLELDSPLGGDVVITVRQRTLDFDGALRCLERAVEFDEKRIADGLDLSAVEARKKRTQQLSVLLEQLDRELVVTLRQRAIAHHV